MNSAENSDALLSSLLKQNPVLAALLGGYLECGRVCISRPELSAFFTTAEVIETTQDHTLFSLQAQDLYVLQSESVAELVRLNSRTAAQILWVSTQADIADSFYDFRIHPDDLRELVTQTTAHLKTVAGEAEPGKFRRRAPRPALFLDRDGVIVEHIDHLHRADEVRLRTGMASLIKKSREQGYAVIVVTNQSGIGRGLFTREDYEKVTQTMLQQLADEGTFVDAIYFSPYFAGSCLAAGLTRKSLRKPRTGMLLTAAREHDIYLPDSIMIGDRATDIITAAQAGLSAGYLLKSTETTKELAAWQNWRQLPYAPNSMKFELCDSFAEIDVPRVGPKK